MNTATAIDLGTVSHGTMRSEDLIPCFRSVLSDLDRNTNEYTVLLLDAMMLTDYDSDEAQYIWEELADALNELAPSHCYFGAHEGDGSDYGFWPDWDSIRDDIHDGELLCVDDRGNSDTIPDDYNGEWVHSNDHGNVTLYVRKNGQDTEIWAIV